MSTKIVAIDRFLIGTGNPAFIIAEAGINHNGDFILAKQMIDVAKNAGANAIKFQTFVTEELVTPGTPKAAYQKKHVSGKDQAEMLKALELSAEEFFDLFNYCKKRKLLFLSTPFDLKSAEFLNELGVAAFKIGSGDLTN